MSSTTKLLFNAILILSIIFICIVCILNEQNTNLRNIIKHKDNIIYDYENSFNKYSSDELMANRGKFESEVKQMLDSALLNEGFIITEFTIQPSRKHTHFSRVMN